MITYVPPNNMDWEYYERAELEEYHNNQLRIKDNLQALLTAGQPTNHYEFRRLPRYAIMFDKDGEVWGRALEIYDHEETVTSDPLTDVCIRAKMMNTIPKLKIKKFTNLLIPTSTKKKPLLEIKRVIFSGPVTTVIWADGTKTNVRLQGDDVMDKEKGLAMAIAKRVFYNNGNYYDVFKKYIKEE